MAFLGGSARETMNDQINAHDSVQNKMGKELTLFSASKLKGLRKIDFRRYPPARFDFEEREREREREREPQPVTLDASRKSVLFK